MPFWCVLSMEAIIKLQIFIPSRHLETVFIRVSVAVKRVCREINLKIVFPTILREPREARGFFMSKNSWMPILGLALSLPSVILGTAYGLFILYKEGYLAGWLAALIGVLVVSNILITMVIYAFKRKN